MRTGSSRLTPHGLRQLYEDAEELGVVCLQVLGVYRCTWADLQTVEEQSSTYQLTLVWHVIAHFEDLADPASKERLGPQFADARDVFDVLLSDGHHKLKALLSPKLHALVWTRALSSNRVVRVTECQVLREDPTDDAQRQRLLVLQELSVVGDGGDASRHQLQFLSTVHPREVELLPLLGGRLYYLPLHSDHYTLDWDCSFTQGEPEEDSPLDELERNWAAKYGSPDAEKQTTEAVAWNAHPEYCDSLRTPECRKVYAIGEALERIKQGKGEHPPMIGAIRVKSRVTNTGEPGISNPFPFVFHAVVVDTTSVFEVAFLGSMCAKYFLSLQEGDLIQFRGYSAVNPHDLQYMTKSAPLIIYQHESSGSALHVPEKYWKYLENTKLAPHVLKVGDDISQEAQRSWGLQQVRPSWLECSFVNILNTLYWGDKAIEDRDVMYFDFVGVLSNVGKIIRGRKRRLDEDGAEVTEFRWVKMIDGSSSHELVIRLGECSQPAVLQSLEAGNTLMITKLQWHILPGAQTGDKRIQYATTSVYSVLRTNEAVLPFQSVEECNLNVYFANTVNKNAADVSRTSKGESKLTAHMEKEFRPRNRLPTDCNQFKETFGLKVCTFSELAMLLLHLEAYEHQHVGFIGQVNAVSIDDDPADDVPPVLLELSESSNADKLLTVAVSINPLYQTPAIKGDVKLITPPESVPLVRLLPNDVVDDMHVQALEEIRPVNSTGSADLKLTLPFIEHQLTTSKREFFFSLQLYRDGNGDVTWDVDAILAVS